MAEIAIGRAEADDVRSIFMRRRSDAATLALAVDLAEIGPAWVARDEGEAIGLCLAHDSQDERYVGELFVEPSYRGQDVGSELLDEAFSGDVTRSVMLDAADRAALTLTVRRGAIPRATVLRVAGPIPREEGLLGMAAGDYRFDVEELDPVARAHVLAELDQTARGVSRPMDHERFARNAAAIGFSIYDEFVAYAYVRADGRIGPIAVASSAYAVQVLAYALVTMQRTHGATWCSALIPATNARLLRAALAGGLRIEESLTFATDAADTPDLSRYAGFHRLLF